jgi:hypothetical protein
MDYGVYQSLEELLSDGTATEFRAIVPEIPVALSREQLLDWPGPGWGGDHEAALAAFKRLVGAADYELAMTQVAALQQAAGPVGHGQAQSQDPAPEPGAAAAEVGRAITAAAIEALRDQYPEVAARFTAEQIRAAALAATSAALSAADE